MQEQTIAAVATPLGTGGIGIVRVSGEAAFAVADRLIATVRGEKLAKMAGYTCAYGRAFDAEGDIDEAVVTVFRAPHSYTGEDVVEIASHGGVYLVNRILRACCDCGARLASAGEFTKRAFLAGKLDLTQAEAVIDLISAQGKQAARAALTARDGALYRAVDAVSERLIAQAAQLVAWIDYPEEDMVAVDPMVLGGILRDCVTDLWRLIASYETGRVLREGIDVAIVGRPNVGKSTLMNLLTGYTRSIVADVAGTTRDVVSDTVYLGDAVLHLSDTAGIRGSDDPIERAGVAMSEERLEQAQLVLAMFDGSDTLNADDWRVIDGCKGATCIALVNKNDLPQRLEVETLREKFEHVITLSAQSAYGADQLKDRITTLFALGEFDSGAAMAANERQRNGVLAAIAELEEGADATYGGVSYDAVCVCVERAVDALLELTGKKASPAVIDQVFTRFCVGK